VFFWFCSSNVQAFNTAVRHLLNSYFANKREQVDQETLLTNLFDAYTACKTTEFVDKIKRHKQAYIDHTANITTETLMDYALKQYQTMVQENTWGVESTDRKDIMLLSAQVVSLHEQVNTKMEDNVSHESQSRPARQYNMTPEQWKQKRYDEAPAWMK
jgi:hypothetical protein